MNQKNQHLELNEIWQLNMKKRFQMMTVIQLKKEKLKMVKQLEQINSLLDEVMSFGDKQDQEDINKQIMKCRKTKRWLIKSLNNFQYMLTGEYSVKADHQIAQLKKEIKTIKDQVGQFSRMVEVPMQKDMEVCQELQKQVYLMEREVEEGRAKIKRKKQKMKQISRQNQKKLELIKEMNKGIDKIFEQAETENISLKESSLEYAKKYQDLKTKKDKLFSLMERDSKRFDFNYKSKLKKIVQIEQQLDEIIELIGENDTFLKQKSIELISVRNQKQLLPLENKKRNSEDVQAFMRKRMQTQKSSEGQFKVRRKRKHSRIQSEAQQNYAQSIAQRRKDKVQSRQNMLPSLYRAMGKEKLQIQEQYNINQLIY